MAPSPEAPELSCTETPGTSSIAAPLNEEAVAAPLNEVAAAVPRPPASLTLPRGIAARVKGRMRAVLTRPHPLPHPPLHHEIGPTSYTPSQ